MTDQDVGFTDPLVGEKAIGRLGVGPVLANQRTALPHIAPNLGQQFAQPLGQTLVRKTTAGKFVIKPSVGRSVHWHRSLRDSVPDKESRLIPLTQ
jgi:hypothetical protein